MAWLRSGLGKAEPSDSAVPGCIAQNGASLWRIAGLIRLVKSKAVPMRFAHKRTCRAAQNYAPQAPGRPLSHDLNSARMAILPIGSA